MTMQREKVMVSDLQFGMFITELDRPWLDSPFLLQGFVLDEQSQLSTLQSLCSFVYVDRTKSIGTQFNAASKLDVGIKREGVTVRIKQVSDAPKSKAKVPFNVPKVMVKVNGDKRKTIGQSSFFEIISAIRQKSIVQTEEGIIFNVREVPTANESDTPKTANSRDNQSIDTSDAFSFFKNLFSSSKEKFKNSISANSHQSEDTFADTNSEAYRVSIYENEVPRVEQEMAIIYPTFEKSQVATKALFEAIANQQNLDISTVSEVLDSMVDSISRTPDALMWLAKLKDADNIAYSQALNVSINMMAFASFIALPKKQIKEMGLAGLLQDIGKVKVPKRILQKSTKLSLPEFEIAKRHIEQGLEILKNSDNIPPLTLEMIAQHHERYDGSGYPNKLHGNLISVNGQIAGLIDTYCAMTTDRSYAKSLHNLGALDEIHQLRDTGFSSELIDQLIQFLGIYPVSSLVELNTGEVAVVIQQNQVRRLQPRLMIVLDQNKTKYRYPSTLDLLTSPLTPDGEPYKIIKAIHPDSYGLNAENFYL